MHNLYASSWLVFGISFGYALYKDIWPRSYLGVSGNGVYQHQHHRKKTSPTTAPSTPATAAATTATTTIAMFRFVLGFEPQTAETEPTQPPFSWVTYICLKQGRRCIHVSMECDTMEYNYNDFTVLPHSRMMVRIRGIAPNGILSGQWNIIYIYNLPRQCAVM